MRFMSSLIVIALLLPACSISTGLRNAAADEAFLSALISPDRNNGKVVTLKGWVSMRHEDWNLWATPADRENWNTARCISLSGYDDLRDYAADFDGKFVEITGTFTSDATEGGRIVRLGACSDIALRVDGLSSVRLASARSP
jgi:hypothetical protein